MTRPYHKRDIFGLLKVEVGKKAGDFFYLHRSAEEYLPDRAQDAVQEAREIAGAEILDVPREPYTLLKLALDGRQVSFLWYPDFDDDPHPMLEASATVNLRAGRVRGANYSETENPPILHRKELMVAPDYPGYDQFAAVTEAEERAGLLDSPPGHLLQWEALVESRGG